MVLFLSKSMSETFINAFSCYFQLGNKFSAFNIVELWWYFSCRFQRIFCCHCIKNLQESSAYKIFQ